MEGREGVEMLQTRRWRAEAEESKQRTGWDWCRSAGDEALAAAWVTTMLTGGDVVASGGVIGLRIPEDP